LQVKIFFILFEDQTSAANDIKIVFESPPTLNLPEMAMFEYHMVKVEQFFLKFKHQTPKNPKLFSVFAKTQKSIYKHVFTSNYPVSSSQYILNRQTNY
jgi:hypothetical protein